MSESVLRVGIVASSPEGCQLLRSHTIKTGLATVEVELVSPGLSDRDPALRSIVDAKPDVVLVDLRESDKAVRSLQVLSNSVPATRLVLCCSPSDPELLLAGVRAGAREFLPRPLSLELIRESLGRFANRPQTGGNGKKTGKTFALLSAKGGAGATSVAINLAFTTAQLPGSRISLIDLARPVGDLAANLNLVHRHSVRDANLEMGRLDHTLLESFMTTWSGISVLPGLVEPQEETARSAGFVEKLFLTTASAYTHSFFDFSSALGLDDLRLVSVAASDILLILTPELPSVWRASTLVRKIAEHGGEDRLRLILNRSHRDDTIRNQEIESVVKYPVFWSLPNNYRAALAAVNAGRAILTSNNNGVAQSYKELANMLEGIPSARKRLASMFSF